MNLFAAAAEVPVSVHEWSQSVSISGIQWAVILALGGVILWFILRDRTGIKETLDRLVSVVEALRLDLASNYAKKLDLEKLDHKIERHIEHGIQRREMERRAVEDAEG